MSDDIPFDMQMEIIKKVYDIKSLIQFRSVSKPWKSFIDSSQFIKGYGSRHTQPHSRILIYRSNYSLEKKYIFLGDDNIETFKVQKEFAPSVVSPLLKRYSVHKVVGASHGLLCLCCYDKFSGKRMVVIWNPSIGKSFGILPSHDRGFDYGFGVCPVTSDHIVVKTRNNNPRHAEVFTLSSGVWNVIPSGNLPRQSITLKNLSTQVVIDRFIYWAANEMTLIDDGESTTYKYMVVSFDLITKEFKVVDLPDTLTNELDEDMSMFVNKLRESLVVYGSLKYGSISEGCGVWVMEHDSSFRKLFTIGVPVDKILAFKTNGETIFETPKVGILATLEVYDPCSQQIKNLGISGTRWSFFMGSYKESLPLLDHSDLRIYCDGN